MSLSPSFGFAHPCFLFSLTCLFLRVAADIHVKTLVRDKDIRKFLDGVYVSEKGKPVAASGWTQVVRGEFPFLSPFSLSLRFLFFSPCCGIAGPIPAEDE